MQNKFIVFIVTWAIFMMIISFSVEARYRPFLSNDPYSCIDDIEFPSCVEQAGGVGDNVTNYNNYTVYNITNYNAADIWVNETGDTMTGNLTMSNKWILNFNTRLGWGNITGAPGFYGGVADDWINETGDVMTGDLNISGTGFVNISTDGSINMTGELYINSAEAVSATLLTLESDINNLNEYNEILFKVIGGVNYGAIRSYIGQADDSYMSFLTTTDGGTLARQMTIQHDGKVGIGTASPQRLLHLDGGANSYARFDTNIGGKSDWTIGADTYGFIIYEESGNYRFVIEEGGNVGIGTNSPNQKLTVQGETNLNGNITTIGNYTITGVGTIIWSNGTIETGATGSDVYPGVADVWVNVTGDTMTGALNMSNQIWLYPNGTGYFDTIRVSNIFGHSPIYVWNQVHLKDNVTLAENKTQWLGNATNWWGKIYSDTFRGITGIFNSIRMQKGLWINATNCDTLDTDSEGFVYCGSDDTGGGVYPGDIWINETGDVMTGNLNITDGTDYCNITSDGDIFMTGQLVMNSSNITAIILADNILGSSGVFGMHTDNYATFMGSNFYSNGTAWIALEEWASGIAFMTSIGSIFFGEGLTPGEEFNPNSIINWNPTSITFQEKVIINANLTAGDTGDVILWPNGTVETGFTDRDTITFAVQDGVDINTTLAGFPTDQDFGFVPARSGSITGISGAVQYDLLGLMGSPKCRLEVYKNGIGTGLWVDFETFGLNNIEQGSSVQAVGLDTFSKNDVMFIRQINVEDGLEICITFDIGQAFLEVTYD